MVQYRQKREPRKYEPHEPQQPSCTVTADGTYEKVTTVSTWQRGRTTALGELCVFLIDIKKGGAKNVRNQSVCQKDSRTADPPSFPLSPRAGARSICTLTG